MLRGVSTGVAIKVVKRLRCAKCHNRLGSYRVAFTPNGVLIEAGRRMPAGVVLRMSHTIDLNREVSALHLFVRRYQWRGCPCGAKPTWRATTLVRKWSRSDGTEYV
jgi:hypothetical protein